MTPNEFNALVVDTVKAVDGLSNKKGPEYSNNSDRLSNFKDLSKEIGIIPEQVLWVYLSKHLSSIKTHLSNISLNIIKELSEPIDGRIHDAILYLLLLKALLKERSSNAKHDPNVERAG
jgi:hypothetical protein